MCKFYMYVDNMKTHKSKRQLVTRSYPYFQKIVSHSPVVENAHLICLLIFHVFKNWFRLYSRTEILPINCKGGNFQRNCDNLKEVKKHHQHLHVDSIQGFSI